MVHVTKAKSQSPQSPQERIRGGRFFKTVNNVNLHERRTVRIDEHERSAHLRINGSHGREVKGEEHDREDILERGRDKTSNRREAIMQAWNTEARAKRIRDKERNERVAARREWYREKRVPRDDNKQKNDKAAREQEESRENRVARERGRERYGNEARRWKWYREQGNYNKYSKRDRNYRESTPCRKQKIDEANEKHTVFRRRRPIFVERSEQCCERWEGLIWMTENRWRPIAQYVLGSPWYWDEIGNPLIDENEVAWYNGYNYGRKRYQFDENYYRFPYTSNHYFSSGYYF